MSNNLSYLQCMLGGLGATPKSSLVILHNDISDNLYHAHGTIVWSCLRLQGRSNMMWSTLIFIPTNRNPRF